MQLLRIVVAVLAFAVAMAAQQPPFEVPLTYFVGASGSNQYPFASPKAVVVGPDGDIWIVGVAQGYGLPIVDPDEGTPSEISCYAPGGEPQSPFEPGVVLDPCSDVFAMRLAADGSGPRFVKYLKGYGLESVEGAAVDHDGNLYLFGTRPDESHPGDEGYLFKIGPHGDTREELPLRWTRPTAVGVDSRGTVHLAAYAARDWHLGGPNPNETSSVITGVPAGQREASYVIQLNQKRFGNVRAEDIAVSTDGWAYVSGVMRYPDFEITWPLAVDPKDNDGDIFVAAINPQGEVAWTASYGGSGAEALPKIVFSPTGEVVVAGWTNSVDLPLRETNAEELSGDRDLFLLGLDAATGQRLYSGYLGFPSETSLRDLASGPDGSVYLSGTATEEQEGEERHINLLLKIDRAGKLVREVDAGAAAIAVTEDGKVITVGSTLSGLLDAGGFLRGQQSVYVALLDLDTPNAAKPWLAAVLNAGDGIPTALSPGAVVSLYGERLGPVEGLAASVEDGRLKTQVGGVRVLVGDTPAPLLYVSAAQINAILPFDLGEDPLAQVVVERDGVRSNVFAMTVIEAAPGPFQQAPPNASFGAILNQDGTLNSPAKPAPAGSVVSLWVSGLGTFSPPLADGEIVATTGPFPGLAAEISVEIGGIPTEIRYAGAAPGLAAGIAQINFVVPAGISDGTASVRIRAGQRQSYPTTQLALRP